MTQPVASWDCADGTPDEDHDWIVEQDWYGDPGVINGTQTFYFKRCRQCGKECDATQADIQGAYDDDDAY